MTRVWTTKEVYSSIVGGFLFSYWIAFQQTCICLFVYDTLGTTINNLLQDIREMLSLWWEVRAALNLSLRCFTFVDAIT